jgi:hypothetical protein
MIWAKKYPHAEAGGYGGVFRVWKATTTNLAAADEDLGKVHLTLRIPGDTNAS